MTFGPISIAPEHKRQGYGKILLDYTMEKAKELGAGALAITGNIDFYGKSGFILASEKGIRYADAEPSDRVVPYFLIKEAISSFASCCLRSECVIYATPVSSPLPVASTTATLQPVR